MIRTKLIPVLAAFALTFLFVSPAIAQRQLTMPELSQAASVSQTIGLTKITVDYHRPLVKNRKIWGGLVPFNKIWRAGANENTTIQFSDPVMINGTEVPAGTYGLHTIPGEAEWTVILNKNSGAWGSYFYDESLDQLRFIVKPATAPFAEALAYYFENPEENSVNLVLHWEKLKIEFSIKVDVKEVVFAHMKQELTTMPGFFWQGYSQAALYCLQNDMHREEAMKLIDISIGKNRNFTNLRVKSGLLQKAGDVQGAEKLMTEANSIATEAEINALGYQYLGAKKFDKAIETFRMNAEKHPDSWNVYDSLGEGYQAIGNRELALENYEKALELVSDAAHKDRLKKTVQMLRN